LKAVVVEAVVRVWERELVGDWEEIHHWTRMELES